MKTLENTTIADLMVKELDNRNMLGHKNFCKLISEVLFKGIAAYLNSLEYEGVIVELSAPFRDTSNNFMNAYFYYDDNNERKLEFYTVKSLKDQQKENDVDEIIYLHDNENAIKFMEAVALLHGMVFTPTKDREKEADNMLLTFACFVYALGNYLLATYDKNGDNTVEIPGIVRVKLRKEKVNKHNEVYLTSYETMLDFKEIDDLTDKVKDRLNKQK